MSERHSLIPAVWAILINRNDEVLLIRRANTGWRDGEYTLPAGHQEKGESPTSAMIRELEEEVGVVAKTEGVKQVHTSIYLADDRKHERISTFFAVASWDGTPYLAEPEKSDDLIWCKRGELPENTVPMVRVILEKVERGETYSELNYADSELTLPKS